MADPKPIKRWAYPVKLNGSATGLEAAMYLAGLARSLGGSYPMGGNGLWHTGVHFDYGSASHVDAKQVYAIADGQLVAYRIDATPLSIHYSGSATDALYSSSFVLLKHQLQIPPVPQAPGAAAPATPPPAQPSITLYSLYMHLLDAKGYSDQPTLPRPPHIPHKCKVKSGLSQTVVGLRIRDKPGGTALGIIPKLCKVEVGAAYAGKADWKKLVAVTGGSAVPAWTSATTAYLYKKDLTDGAVGAKCNDREATIAPTVVAYVYKDGKSAGQKIIANLPEGAIVTLGQQSPDDSSYYTILALENMQGFPEPKDAAGKYYGWIDKQDFDDIPFTAPASVQQPSPPLEVKAGDLIGHPGVFQHHNNTTAQIQIHIELFTPDNLPDFITKSRAWAASPNILQRDKTLLKVPKGTKLIAAKSTDSVETPPKTTDAGTEIHTDLVIPLRALHELQTQYKISAPESAAANAKKIRWWYLENIGGKADGAAISGWLCEKNTTAITPWHWEGFATVEDSTADEKLLAYQLKNVNKLQAAELTTYSAIATEAKSWPLMAQLMSVINANKVIDVVADPLTPSQLTSALKAYWCAQKIAGIAVKTATEWKKDTARWDKLDTLMGHHPDSEHPDWLTEKTKIEKLSFWDSLSIAPSVWFLHAPWASANMQKIHCSCTENFLFSCTKYGASTYGPVYRGTTSLNNYAGWATLIANTGANNITEQERRVLEAMSPNEGNMEAIQSYDSEIVTAGCMQKTVNSEGRGQLTDQIAKFKLLYPDFYEKLFVACGWQIVGEGVNAVLKYQDPYLTGVPLLGGAALKTAIRAGFNAASYKTKIVCKPLACLVPAISHPAYMELQVLDFAIDLRRTLALTPTGYSFTVGEYFQGDLGQSVALDHHVNRPGHVTSYLAKALDTFYAAHPTLSKTNVNWGAQRATYEAEIAEIYGPLRGTNLMSTPMTDATGRYNNLKNHFS